MELHDADHGGTEFKANVSVEIRVILSLKADAIMPFTPVPAGSREAS